MNFEPSSDQRMIVETFGQFFDEHSSMRRVRAALPLGFDRDLWRELGAMGAYGIRAPEASGGMGLGLFDAVLLMAEAGRTLSSVPLAEAIVAARLLSETDHADARAWLGKLLSGESVVTLALRDAAGEPHQFVPGGAVADAILCRDGDDFVLIVQGDKPKSPANLASSPIAKIDLKAGRRVLASGAAARDRFLAGIEEWKLLTAAALQALSKEAIRLAAVYAGERIQFGVPIGTYQGVSHPLADYAVETEGVRYLIWKTIRDIADGSPEAGAMICLSYWAAARAAGGSVGHALQCFGGYGLTTEYDIHLYNLRAKGWPGVFGDSEQQLLAAANRLWAGEKAPLPDAGAVGIEFDLGEEARALVEELQAFCHENITPALRAKAHYSFDGFDAGFHKKLAQAKLVFPSWPKEYGGRGAQAYAHYAFANFWEEIGWAFVPMAVTNLVGSMMMRFGSDRLKEEVLSRVVSGDSICCLGFSEPGSGSDVFAAKLQAVRDGDDWVINGQKMFTSGAEHADYVLVLARTNNDVPKHKGLTMFIVPLKAPGVALQPIYTFQEERTNITFYSDVRIPDAYRLGDVDGGAKTMSAALEIEQSGGGMIACAHGRAVEAAVDFAKTTIRDGRALIDHEDAKRRLARAKTHVIMSFLIAQYAVWSHQTKQPFRAQGSASKLYATEYFYTDTAELLDLCAPDSLPEGGALGSLNLGYRHAHATRIYGGTSQVHRSMVAERFLGLPRSRS